MSIKYSLRRILFISLLFIIFDIGLANNAEALDVTALDVTAASLSVADIQSACNQVEAAGGGIVYLPAGTVTWSSQLKISDGVSIIGQGEGITNISNFRLLMRTAYYGYLGKGMRFSGFTAMGSSNIDIYDFNPQPKTVANGLRIDHITMHASSGTGINIRGGSSPVLIDHLTLTISGAAYGIGVSGAGGSYPEACPPLTDGTVAGQGGVLDAVYIEDSTLGANPSSSSHFVITYSNSRVVVRNSDIGLPHNTGSSALDAHGKRTTGAGVGSRLYEIYDNRFHGHPTNGQWKSIGIRGGDALIYNNNFHNHAGTIMFMVESNYCGDTYEDQDCCATGETGSHIWNNTYTTDDPGAYPDGVGVGHSSECPPDDRCWTAPVGNQYCCKFSVGNSYNGYTQGFDFIKENRDFYFRAPSQSLDGWTYTPYPYPHALASGSLPTDPDPAIPKGVLIDKK